MCFINLGKAFNCGPAVSQLLYTIWFPYSCGESWVGFIGGSTLALHAKDGTACFNHREHLLSVCQRQCRKYNTCRACVEKSRGMTRLWCQLLRHKQNPVDMLDWANIFSNISRSSNPKRSNHNGNLEFSDGAQEVISFIKWIFWCPSISNVFFFFLEYFLMNSHCFV